MHNPPTTEYSGLTLVLDHPSRHDTQHLLSGIAGKYVEECLAPITLNSCDIRVKDNKSPLLPHTRYVGLLGIKGYQEGYPSIYQGIRAIHTFFPQDTCDYRNLESTEEDEDDAISDSETKDSYPTRRSNYRFWLRWHLRKLVLPGQLYQPRIHVYPSEKVILDFLRGTRNTDLYLDIETSRVHRAISCIGVSSPAIFPQVYVIPVYLYNGRLAYLNWHLIYREFFEAFLTNTVVAHNAAFDLTILRAWYKFPFPLNVYCTMCANHRCFPEAEKSLSHCIVQWTEQPYHKDVATEVFNESQQNDMWYYNGKDVFNLHLIKTAQLSYAKSVNGLPSSIEQANASIIPYLDTTAIRGLILDEATAIQTESALAVEKSQLARVASILVGSEFNPASAKQCVDFFHKKLNYSVAAKTNDGKPSVGRKQLYQLMLKYNNPVIPVILKYRKTAKDLSMLCAERWVMP